MFKFKTLLLMTSTSLVLASGLATTAAAQATAPEPSEAATLGEVVVTAQKRAERLLDVPVPVTAVEAQALTRQNLVSIVDYANRIPGLSAIGIRQRDISIRGITTGGANNPTIAITIDDVPFGSSTFAGQGVFPDLDPADLQRVEVLRGPQGTLYGAASLGGLIKLVTADPSTTDFTARVEVGASGVDSGGSGYTVRGATNIPIIQGKLGARLSAFRREDPAYVRNIHPTAVGDNVNSSLVKGYRGALQFTPTDKLSINLSRLYQKRETEDGATIQLKTAPTVAFPTDYTPLLGDFVRNNAASQGYQVNKLTTARVAYDLDWADLTAVSAWGRSANDSDSDLSTTFPFILSAVYPTAGAGAVVRLGNGSSTKKFSQEVRLASSGSGPLEWLVGAFYTDEDSTILQVLRAVSSTGATVGTAATFPITSSFKEKAVFGDVTYHFTPQFDVQIGGRLSKNKQVYQSAAIVDAPAQPFFGVNSSTLGKSKDNAFTWLVTPRYRFDDNTMAYARFASGYRPGGPNTGVAGVPSSFDSDSVTNYEAGVKGYLFDRKVSYDVSVFQIDWQDIQLQFATASSLSYQGNGGKARSRGLESALQWRPIGGLSLGWTSAWTKAELTQNLPVPTGGTGLFGAKGDALPYAPKFTSNLSADQRWNLGDVTVFVGANYTYQGDRWSQFVSTAAPAARRTRIKLPAYSMIDLRAGLERDGWQLNVFARNIGDKRGIVNIDNRQGVSAAVNADYVRPRTYGVNLSAAF